MNLQQQYTQILEGKGNKDFFMKNVRRIFPQYTNQYTSFDEAIHILKNKQLLFENVNKIEVDNTQASDWQDIFKSEMKNYKQSLTEAKKKDTTQPEKEVLDIQKKQFDNKNDKNIDNVYGNTFLNGYYTEMKDPANKDKTVDELKEIVRKNLAKDINFYTKEGMFGTKGIGTETTTDTKIIKGKFAGLGMEEVDNKSTILKESLNENGIDLDTITSQMYKEYKDFKGWPKEVGKDLRSMKLSNDQINQVLNNLHGEDYFDDSEVELNESLSYSDLEKGKEYVWNGGAEYQTVTYIGLTKDNPDKKPGSSMGKGFLFQWDDGKYFELSNPSIRQYVKEVEEELNENKNMKNINLQEIIKQVLKENSEKEKTPKSTSTKKDDVTSRLKRFQEESNTLAMSTNIESIINEIKRLKDKVAMAEQMDEMKEFTDPVKMKNIQKEINELEKAKAKLEKLYEKKTKGKPKSVVTDSPKENLNTSDDIENNNADEDYKRAYDFMDDIDDENLDETLSESHETILSNIKDKLDDLIDSGKAGSVEQAVKIYLSNHPEHKKYENEIAMLTVR